MKNTLKFLGIIAFIAVIGFAAASCSDDDSSPFDGTWKGTKDDVTYTVTIAGDDITATDGTNTLTGTLDEQVETGYGYKRNVLENGKQVGNVIVDADVTKLDITLISGSLGIIYVSGMTK